MDVRSFAIAFAVALAGSCAPQDDGRSTLQRIREEGVVRVGYANEAPYAFMMQEEGKLTGEAPEIARVVLGRLGVDEIEGVLTEFGSLIPGLKAKRFDIIAAGMYILPERCREVAFTNPTYKVGEGFLVQNGNPLELHSYEDLASHATARLGVVAGAVELGYARRMGVPDDRISVLPDAASAVAAVAAGRIDAYAGTSLTLRDLKAKLGEGGLELADPFTDPVIESETVIGYGAFAVRKEDTDLLEALNEQLGDFIGTPEHRELVAPFGFTEAELPGDTTAGALCQG